MAYATPRVSAGYLCDDRIAGLTIKLDSPAWFAWLETPANVCFNYALVNHTKGYIDGYVTVRKEARQRGNSYWTAYRRQGKRLHKVYLGPSATVTQARLEVAVARLHARDGPVVATSSTVVWPADMQSGRRPDRL